MLSKKSSLESYFCEDFQDYELYCMPPEYKRLSLGLLNNTTLSTVHY